MVTRIHQLPFDKMTRASWDKSFGHGHHLFNPLDLEITSMEIDFMNLDLKEINILYDMRMCPLCQREFYMQTNTQYYDNSFEIPRTSLSIKGTCSCLIEILHLISLKSVWRTIESYW